jgi:hypothetical protein
MNEAFICDGVRTQLEAAMDTFSDARGRPGARRRLPR